MKISNSKERLSAISMAVLAGLLLNTSATVSPATAAQELSPAPKLDAVSFTKVTIEDKFWAPKMDTNRLSSISENLKNLEKAGNIANLDMAGRDIHEGYHGPLFMDSDLYKGMEAASYTLATDYTPELDKELDRIIEIIGKAQDKNGYINSYFTVVKPNERWTNLRDAHELYCAGHMFEAAVAHYQATGKKNFLDIATRFADYIDSVFGDEEGKRAGYAGHPEIELALIKLWKATNNDRYLKLANFFTVHRGEKFFATEAIHKQPLDRYNGEYWQDAYPITETTHIMGHAVRAAYLLSGCVDVGSATGNEDLLKMVRRVWNNTVYKNIYITGGIGPSAQNEGFTVDYDLPNDTAYQETCASVAMILLNHRLNLLYGDAKYANVMEYTLYNGFLSGVNLKGDRFFYVNPLESSGTHHRSAWFGCACCPPNVARTLASLGEYAYATGSDSLWVNLFIQGEVVTEVNGQPVKMRVITDYPWNGKVVFSMLQDQPADFTLRIRKPDHSPDYSLETPDNVQIKTERGYLCLSKDTPWKKGDKVIFDMNLQVRKVLANPNVKADNGKVALMRGPIVYCFEGIDQGGNLDKIYLPVDSEFTATYDKDMLNGVTVLTGKAKESEAKVCWTRALYQDVPSSEEVDVKAIPYYAWDNRDACTMKVWLPKNPDFEYNATEGYEGFAKTTLSFTSYNCFPAGINDGKPVQKSNIHPYVLTHFWPHLGGTEWVSYSWDTPIETECTRIYWFDDTGVGNIRPPKSWTLEYLDENGKWQPVQTTSPYSCELDKWIEIKHKPIATKAMKVTVQQQDKFAVGIHEWQVIPLE